MSHPWRDRVAIKLAPASMIGADLPVRAVAGVVMMVGALGVTFFGGFPFLAFWGLASFGVLFEWQRLVGGTRPWARMGLGALTLIAVAPFAFEALSLPSLFTVLAGAVAVGAVSAPAQRVWSGAGVLYAGALMVGASLLRASPAYGLAAVLWLFAVVWGADVMAYFGGRLIGGPKLWPAISPGKTWSGAVVGASLGGLIGAGVAMIASPTPVAFGPILALGVITAIASQGGDLFESFLKRRAGVKDSGRLIPGHGGLMDRLDGFIVATALAAIVAAARSQGAWIAPGLFQW